MADVKPDTWMPFYVGDYLRDTGHLTTEEHGAYVLLIIQAWTREGVLPLDADRLRVLTRMDAKAWKRSAATLLAFFVKTDAGYRHKRIDAELARTALTVEQRRTAGKASAEARARKRDGNGRSTSVATEHPTEPPRNGRPSQSQERKKELSSPLDSQTPREPTMPARSASPDVWAPLVSKWEVDKDGVKRPVCGGYYLDFAADAVCTAAKINDANWRGDWRPLIGWLADDIDLPTIVRAIETCAVRPKYEPPRTLKYFDQPVRDAAKMGAAA